MRLVLLAILSLASAFAADMCYAHVQYASGEEFTGWWDKDSKVLYLPDGGCRLMDQADVKVSRAAAPDGSARPERRKFTFLTTLPYGRVTFGDQVLVGWVHRESGTVFTEGVPGGVHFSPDHFKSLDPMPAPGIVPMQAWPWLNHWVVEHAEPPAIEQAKP
jgi:hypothetical protein